MIDARQRERKRVLRLNTGEIRYVSDIPRARNIRRLDEDKDGGEEQS
jgi:hypothetical protein